VVVSIPEFINFSLSELEVAINGNNLIGEGGACMVYKVCHMMILVR